MLHPYLTNTGVSSMPPPALSHTQASQAQADGKIQPAQSTPPVRPPRATRKGQPKSEATRAAMSEARKGKHHSPETKARIAQSMLGKRNALGTGKPPRDTAPRMVNPYLLPPMRPPLGMRKDYPPHKEWKKLILPMHDASNPDNWIAEMPEESLAEMKRFLDLPTEDGRPEMLLVEVNWDDHTFVIHGYLCVMDPGQTVNHVSGYIRKIQHIPRLINEDKITFVPNGVTPTLAALSAYVLLFNRDIMVGPRDHVPRERNIFRP